MKARTKSVLILTFTLVVGGLIGSLATSAVHNYRWEQIRKLSTHEGFVEAMEDVVDVDDAAQREQVRAVLDQYADYVSDARRAYYHERRDLASSLHVRLSALLEADQRAELDRWAERELSRWGRYEKRSRHNGKERSGRDK